MPSSSTTEVRIPRGTSNAICDYIILCLFMAVVNYKSGTFCYKSQQNLKVKETLQSALLFCDFRVHRYASILGEAFTSR